MSCQSALRDLVAYLLGVQPSTPNVPLVVAGGAAFAVALFAGLALARTPPNLRRYDPDEHGPEWQGFRGLLILLAVAVCFEPFRLAIAIACNAVALTTETWDLIADGSDRFSGDWGAAYLVAQAIGPGLQLGMAVAVGVAMFGRRRSFRALALGYLVGSIVIFGVNEFLLTQVFFEYREVLNENTRRLTALASLSLPVAGYLLFSRRVHRTFRG